MGLKKNREILDSDNFGDYWNIEDHRIHKKTESASVTMALYKNQGSYQAGKRPSIKLSFHFSSGFSVGALNANNPYELIYTALKLLPEFVGAIDILEE